MKDGFKEPGLRYKQFQVVSADDSRLFLPRTPNMFSQNDPRRFDREKNQQSRLTQAASVRNTKDWQGENTHIFGGFWGSKQ